MRFYLLVTLLLWAPLQTSPKYGTIEGTVTRFGTEDPIPDVEIVITGSGRLTNWLTPQAVTDSRGRFVIGDVLPGSYSVRAQRLGYANPAPNGVRVMEGGATRTVVVAAGKRTENANLTLVRAGAIYGRILDSAGKPLVDQDVGVISMDERGGPFAQTDDRGAYHIVGIPPGNYNLAFPEATSVIYYPGVTERAKATVLEILEGTVLTGLDITFNNGAPPSETEKTFNISGKALDRDGTPTSGMFQIVDLLSHAPIEPGKSALYSRLSWGSSTFDFRGVRPGHYDIVLFFANSNSSTDDVSRLGVVGRLEVHVSDGDLKDVVVAPGGVSVNGQVATIGNASSASASVRLKMPSNSVRSLDAKSGASGDFMIPNVVSGTWKVVVSDLAADQALLDVREDDISVYDNGFSVEDRTPKPIQVILGSDGAS